MWYCMCAHETILSTSFLWCLEDDFFCYRNPLQRWSLVLKMDNLLKLQIMKSISYV